MGKGNKKSKEEWLKKAVDAFMIDYHESKLIASLTSLNGRRANIDNTVQCCECSRFKLGKHPHIGRCLEGQIEAIAGLWDTDNRYCKCFNEDINSKEKNNVL